MYKTSPSSRTHQPRLWAVLPVKQFVHAKQRLAGVLGPRERRALSQAMVEDTLACLQEADGLDGTLLVSDDPAAEPLAVRYGAALLRDKAPGLQGGGGLNAALTHAAHHLTQRGASHLLVLHGDLPCVTQTELAALSVDLPPAGRAFVRLVPDRRGEGTNGLLCSLPLPIAFAYGDDSLRVHRESCERSGVPCRVMPLDGFALDIDTPADLQLLAARAALADVGVCTAALLERHEVLERFFQRDAGAIPDPRGPTLEAKPHA